MFVWKYESNQINILAVIWEILNYEFPKRIVSRAGQESIPESIPSILEKKNQNRFLLGESIPERNRF